MWVLLLTRGAEVVVGTVDTLPAHTTNFLAAIVTTNSRVGDVVEAAVRMHRVGDECRSLLKDGGHLLARCWDADGRLSCGACLHMLRDPGDRFLSDAGGGSGKSCFLLSPRKGRARCNSTAVGEQAVLGGGGG